MEQLDLIYKQSFFGKRFKLSWRAPIVCEAILKQFPDVKSTIDVGCAVGDIVKGFMDLGLDAYGLEGAKGCLPFLECPKENVYIHDLRTLVNKVVDRKFDLVTCFEVAEHIEPDWALIFVRNVTDLSDRVLASFAPPGQGGHYHVNCQPMGYWEILFGRLGYVRKPKVEVAVKASLERWAGKPGIKAIYQNLGYFEVAI